MPKISLTLSMGNREVMFDCPEDVPETDQQAWLDRVFPDMVDAAKQKAEKWIVPQPEEQPVRTDTILVGP